MGSRAATPRRSTRKKSRKAYRQTPAEDRQEINNIRNYSKTDDYRGRYGGGWTGSKVRDAGKT